MAVYSRHCPDPNAKLMYLPASCLHLAEQVSKVPKAPLPEKKYAGVAPLSNPTTPQSERTVWVTVGAGPVIVAVDVAVTGTVETAVTS